MAKLPIRYPKYENLIISFCTNTKPTFNNNAGKYKY